MSAADAFADAHRAGLGGWWTVPGQEAAKDAVFRFSIPLHRESLPDWLQSNSLQSFIIRSSRAAAASARSASGCCTLVDCMLVLRQLCDNSAVVACSRKGLCSKIPLCWILQAFGYYCSCHGVALGMHHTVFETFGLTHCPGVIAPASIQLCMLSLTFNAFWNPRHT